MKVKWLNCRLTFQGETPQEDEALNTTWAAFGSQVDDDLGIDSYCSKSGECYSVPAHATMEEFSGWVDRMSREHGAASSVSRNQLTLEDLDYLVSQKS